MEIQRAIDVIVPVYKGFEETKQCIDSLLLSDLSCCNQIIVVNDASPDEKIVEYCNNLPGSIKVIHNETNLGFVVSVNKGMNENQGSDVILLNSDCLVNDDWLSRLHQCAYSETDIATVTPFTNNGTICSYPVFNYTNEIPMDINFHQLDAIFKKVNFGKKHEIPTAVGFCMYIKRQCLDDVGLFDENLFGTGYGEENEFSLRSSRKGWKHVLCADTFVFHHGSISFGDNKYEQMKKADQALIRLFPEYAEMVRTFIADDPIRPYRDAVDDERKRQVGSCDNIILEQRTYRDCLLNTNREQSKLINDINQENKSYKEYLEETRREYSDLSKSFLKVESLAKENYLQYQKSEQKRENTIHQYEKTISEKIYEMEKMNEDFIRDKQNLIKEYESSMDKLSYTIASLEDSVKEKQDHINEMINSRSWRYTKWLRWLSRKMVK